MGADFDFVALTEVGEATREDILEELPVETLAEGVRDLESDDAVAIPKVWSRKSRRRSSMRCRRMSAIVLRRSLDYPEDSAGRLMQTTLSPCRPSGRGASARFLPRDAAKRICPRTSSRSSSSIPATACSARFSSTLWCAPSQAAARGNHAGGPPAGEFDEEGAEAARIFERYNLVSVPVVDESERLVGVITIDDIVDVIQEEASEEIKALGGVNPEEN